MVGIENETARVWRSIALAALTALAIYLCWKMLAPFVNAFTWAAALAVACAPLRRWLFARMPRAVASLLIIVLIIVLIAVPATFVVRQLVEQSLKAQSLLQSSMPTEGWRSAVSGHRWLGPLWNWADRQFDLSQVAQHTASKIASWLAPAVAKSLSILSQTGAMLLALFFFLRDGESILAGVGRVLPLTAEETDRLLARVTNTIRIAVYGRVFIGFVQGALGGVIFAIVGLPAAVFWGAVMSFLSILPMLGSFIVWIPACVYLLLTGHWVAAVVVAVWGVAVINPVDNILYPVLVGSRVGLHSLILFVAFVGGLVAFGPTGLILGPFVVAVSFGLAEIWQERQLAEAGAGSA
jgi:predicted PurR-regulated permease PerM